MKDFLVKLINLLVEDTSSITVTEDTQTNISSLTIACPASQIGRVIGKSGHSIRALRTLLNLKAINQNKQVIIKLLEPVN